MKTEGAGERERDRRGGIVSGGTGVTGSPRSSKSERKPATNPAASVARMWSHRIASYHRYHKNVQLATVAAAVAPCCPMSIESAATKKLNGKCERATTRRNIKNPSTLFAPLS